MSSVIQATPDLLRDQATAIHTYRDWRAWLFSSAILLQLLTSHPGVKLVLLSIAAIAGYSLISSRGFQLSREWSFLAGLCLFGVAYVVSPYWSRFSTSAQTGLISCVVLWTLGLVWSWCFCKPIVYQPHSRVSFSSYFPPIVLALLLIWSSLFVAMAWRGDEEIHIWRVGLLKDAWLGAPLKWLVPAAMAMSIVVVCKANRYLKMLWLCALLIGLLSLAGWLVSRNIDAWENSYVLRRYPLTIVWAQTMLTWCLHGWEFAVTTEAGLTRLLPALSIVLLSIFWTTKLNDLPLKSYRSHIFLKIVVSLSLVTIPLVLYFATIPYIEVPVFLLMTWVCFDGDKLLKAVIRNDSVSPAWIALGVIPFIKETCIVFSTAVICCAAVVLLAEIRKDRSLWRRMLLRWFGLALVVYVPIIIYLYFRNLGPSLHYAYEFYLPNFSEIKLFLIFLSALWEQCGVLLLLSAVGFIYACRHRPWLALFCLVVFTGYFLFYYGDAHRRGRIDGISLPGYAGYARWTLFMLPSLLVMGWHGLNWMVRRRVRWALVISVIWLACNLWMSPLRWNGSRIAGWGDYVRDTQEHTYPYLELYSWFQQKQGDRHASVAIIGRRYNYRFGDDMCIRRFGLNLSIAQNTISGRRARKLLVGQSLCPLSFLEDHFAQAVEDQHDYIVIHQPVWGPKWPDYKTFHGYQFTKVFSLSELRLIVYERPS